MTTSNNSTTYREILALPTVSSFISGGIAGAVSRTVVSPFERIKIIFQVQRPGSTAYKGVIPTLKRLWQEEGWRGFMRGNGINCIRIIPYSAVQFSAYTMIKSMLENDQVIDRLMAGSLAGVISVSVTYPLDIVRTRLSIQTCNTKMWNTMKEIYQTEGGLKGLYRGIIPTTMGVAPYVGINFAVYEYIRKLFIPIGKKEPSSISKLLAGAISGAIAQTMTFPFDVLRRRFQVVGGVGNEFQYNSVYHALSTIIKSEGLKGLYKGLSANLLKVVPSMAASWLTFEFVRDLLVVRAI